MASEAEKSGATDELVVTLTREQLRSLVSGIREAAVPPKVAPDDMLNAGDAAAALNLSVADLDFLVDVGELRRIKGGRWGHTGIYDPCEVGALAVRRARNHRYHDTGPEVPMDRPQHLYVIELVGHAVKIGVTTKPDLRLKQHASTARNHGHQIGRAWFSHVHYEARENERLMKKQSKSEYLRRPFDEVLAEVVALPMTRVGVSHG